MQTGMTLLLVGLAAVVLGLMDYWWEHRRRKP